MPEITTPQTTETAPAPAQTTPRPPVKPNGGRKKKKMVKNLIILAVVLALLAAGGFALYRFLFSTGGEEGEIFSQPAFLGSIQSKANMVVLLLLEAGDLPVPVHQHGQGGRLDTSHIQGAVIEDGEKARGIDPHQPIRFLAAQG